MPLLICLGWFGFGFGLFFFLERPEKHFNFPKSPLDISQEIQSWGCCPTSLLLAGELSEVLPIDISCSSCGARIDQTFGTKLELSLPYYMQRVAEVAVSIPLSHVYSLLHVCINEKSSIFVVFSHALLIFILEFPFLSIVS